MRAIALQVDRHPTGTGGTALILMRPCWLARLLGAREQLLRLERGGCGWRAAGTGREIDHLPYASLIRNALDFSERVIPIARSIG